MNRESSRERAQKIVDCMGFMISNTWSSIAKICSTLQPKKIHPEETIVASKVFEGVLDWHSSTPTYGPYHWWPWKSFEHLGQEIYIHNNLYAEGGALDKYDTLFSVKSVEYQKNKYFRSHHSSSLDKDWAGFCDKAAVLSCLWENPKYGVTVIYNTKQIYFTREDISALMIIACDNTTTDTQEFYGERYNGRDHEDIHEPYPKKLLCLLQKMCKKNTPFCVDNSNDECVWNYPMSRVQVAKYNYQPEALTQIMDTDNEEKALGLGIGCSDGKGEDRAECIPTKGNIEYYNFIMTSEAYPMNTINVWGWVHTYQGTDTEGWISKKTPDFLWRVFKQNGKWQGASTINPEVNCAFVHELYKHSFYNNQIYNM